MIPCVSTGNPFMQKPHGISVSTFKIHWSVSNILSLLVDWNSKLKVFLLSARFCPVVFQVFRRPCFWLEPITSWKKALPLRNQCIQWFISLSSFSCHVENFCFYFRHHGSFSVVLFVTLLLWTLKSHYKAYHTHAHMRECAAYILD